MMDPFLTLPQVAVLLKVPKKTVYTMAQRGQTPAFTMWGQWQFKHDDIDNWIEEQKVPAKASIGKGASDV